MVPESKNSNFVETVVMALNAMRQSLARIEDAVCQNAIRSIDPNGSYSRQEAAAALSVSVWLIDRARKNGLLVETRRLGERDIRITGESLARFHQERETRARVRVNKI